VHEADVPWIELSSEMILATARRKAKKKGAARKVIAYAPDGRRDAGGGAG